MNQRLPKRAPHRLDERGLRKTESPQPVNKTASQRRLQSVLPLESPPGRNAHTQAQHLAEFRMRARRSVRVTTFDDRRREADLIRSGAGGQILRIAA